MFKKYIMMFIVAFAMVISGMSIAHANEPIVDLGEIVHGDAEFSADVTEFSKAALRAKSGQKIYLNVQVKPMTRKQIKPGTCRTAPVGKWFFNEMVDPATGKSYYKRMRVQAGDNIFCMDHAGDWRKKSCRNKEKGLFGVPKPPKSKIRAKGVIRDFLAASGKVAGEGEIEGHAEAHVVQYDDNGRKVCEAKARVDGRGWGMFSAWIKVRSRSMASFSAQASRQIKAKLRSSTKVSGSLMGKLRLSIEGKAMAMCDVPPPPPPPPPTDEAPSLDASAVVCTTPGGVDDIITARGTNNDTVTRTLVFSLSEGPTSKPNIVRTVGAGSTTTVQFTGLEPGDYVVEVTVDETDLSDSESVTLRPCPPPDNPPTIDEVGVVNDVVEYNARTIDVFGTGTPGEIIDLFATAKNGGTITAGKNQSVTVDSNGNWSATVEYTAGERPKNSLTYAVDGNEYTIAAGKDVVWFKASDESGQYVWEKSNDFEILTRPITP